MRQRTTTPKTAAKVTSIALRVRRCEGGEPASCDVCTLLRAVLSRAGKAPIHLIILSGLRESAGLSTDGVKWLRIFLHDRTRIVAARLSLGNCDEVEANDGAEGDDLHDCKVVWLSISLLNEVEIRQCNRGGDERRLYSCGLTRTLAGTPGRSRSCSMPISYRTRA